MFKNHTNLEMEMGFMELGKFNKQFGSNHGSLGRDMSLLCSTLCQSMIELTPSVNTVIKS